jgi:hypothetical protein
MHCKSGESARIFGNGSLLAEGVGHPSSLQLPNTWLPFVCPLETNRDVD